MTESTDNQLPDEQQLDEYLKGDSSVSRQYRQLQSAEVPADLDRLVLRQAEDAVKKRSTTRPAWVKWTAPLAVAASAVLVLSIVIETGVRDETAALRVPQPTMQAKQRERAESKAEEAIVSEQAAPSAAAESSGLAESAREDRVADNARNATSPTYAPVAPPPLVHLDPAAPQAVPYQSEPAPQASRAIAQSLPTAPAAAAPPPEVTTAGESVSRSADIATQVLQASTLEEAAQKQNAAVADEARREQERSAPASVAYSRRISAEMAAPPQSYSDPGAWLKDIRQLRKDNKQEQADREWRRFRAAFPKYEVAETDLARETKK